MTPMNPEGKPNFQRTHWQRWGVAIVVTSVTVESSIVKPCTAAKPTTAPITATMAFLYSAKIISSTFLKLSGVP